MECLREDTSPTEEGIVALADAGRATDEICIPAKISVRVHPLCCVLHLARRYDIQDVAVCMGATYFLRAMDRIAVLDTVYTLGWVSEDGWLRVLPEATQSARGVELVLLYVTCVHLAAKFTGRPAHAKQLSLLVRAVFGKTCMPLPHAIEKIEKSVLDVLDWRLGPAVTPF